MKRHGASIIITSRDIEFDLEDRINDCLYCLFPGQAYSPNDLDRVSHIFDSPQFFDAEGYARSDDIVQGEIGDCWLLSAIATVSTIKGLVERLCVAVCRFFVLASVVDQIYLRSATKKLVSMDLCSS